MASLIELFFNPQHHCTVADSDLEIRGGGQSSIALDKGVGPGLVKIFFVSSVCSQNKGGGGGAVLLGPSPGSATAVAAPAHYISSGAFSEQTTFTLHM